jgi:hypothetical protein
MKARKSRVRRACLRAVNRIPGFWIKKLESEKILIYFEYAG